MAKKHILLFLNERQKIHGRLVELLDGGWKISRADTMGNNIVYILIK